MLARKHWNIFIVDDEPDIHEVSELLLKKEDFFGVRLKFHHANSAKQAIEMIKADFSFELSTAVALIDVVMETDTAGLDLTRFIREERQRLATSIILRTGQPGVAPPRKVIDEYNITGYLTKMEATADRLYMLVKLGVQRYFEVSLVQNRNILMDNLRETAHDKQKLFEGFAGVLGKWGVGPGSVFHSAHDFFGEYYVGSGVFAEKADYLAIKEDLLKKAEPLLATGNRIATVDNYTIIQTKVLGTDKLATLVLKDAIFPRGLLWYYGALIRQSIAYIAEVLNRP